MVTCRYPDAEPCAWASYGALGEFCQSRGIWKPNYKSFALLFPLRRLHRRNRPMAAGNLFLRIRIKFSFTHRHADMLPAFQAKRLSSSVLYDRVRNDTAFCGGLRSDSLYLLPGIRVSQVLSGCLIILGIVILFIISKRQVVRQ